MVNRYETDADKLMVPRGQSAVVSNLTVLKANAASSEDIVHGLGNQFPPLSVMVMPASGTYQDTWINGEGVITVEFVDENTIRLLNESGLALDAGRVKAAVWGAVTGFVLSSVVALIVIVFEHYLKK